MATTTATAISAANTDDVYGSRSNQPGSGNNAAQYDTGYLDIADHPPPPTPPSPGCVFTIPALPDGQAMSLTSPTATSSITTVPGQRPVSIKSQVKLISGTPVRPARSHRPTPAATRPCRCTTTPSPSPRRLGHRRRVRQFVDPQHLKRGPSVTDHLKERDHSRGDTRHVESDRCRLRGHVGRTEQRGAGQLTTPGRTVRP